MTAKYRNATSSGTSTEQTPEPLSALFQSRIAVALLRQTVTDLAGKDLKLRVQAAAWLNSPGAKEVCAAIPVSYDEIWESVRDITFRPYAQRVYLARRLVKSLPAS